MIQLIRPWFSHSGKYVYEWAWSKRRMKIMSQDRSELMEVSALDRVGNELVIKGKVFGSMPMTARLTPEEARKGVKLLTPRMILFLLSFLFRSSGKKKR